MSREHFFTTRAFLPFLAKPGGKIAIISSRMGSNTDSVSGGSYIYRASKAAATNLASNLAIDLKQDGVAVGAYHPGHVGTDMVEKPLLSHPPKVLLDCSISSMPSLWRTQEPIWNITVTS